MDAKPHLKLVTPEDESQEREDPWEDGFDGIFRRYSPYVAAIGIKLLGRDDEVDDLVQDVFLEAYRGLHKLREPAAIKGWLATVAVRTAKRKLRKRRAKRFVGLDQQGSYIQLADSAASPEQRAVLVAVFRFLDTIPVEERLAWTLRHVQGEKLPDVATLCGCSLATVKRRISAAQTKIDGAFDGR
jgi:RNA polymerase sigma-70 factor (ECF subfamily)